MVILKTRWLSGSDRMADAIRIFKIFLDIFLSNGKSIARLTKAKGQLLNTKANEISPPK